MGRSVVLSADVTSGPVTAPINALETEIFCRRHLKINNFVVKIFSNEILWFFFFQRYIQNPVYVILLGCIEISHFYPYFYMFLWFTFFLETVLMKHPL